MDVQHPSVLLEPIENTYNGDLTKSYLNSNTGQTSICGNIMLCIYVVFLIVQS